VSNDDKWSPTKPSIPRQRAAGQELWRLHDHTGQTQTCELRNQSDVGAGWDVLISLNGEPSFSRRCVDEQVARFVAEAIRQDNTRGGWVAAGESNAGDAADQ
jgi:hypothetical protein